MRRAAGLEGFDDDHAPATAAAGVHRLGVVVLAVAFWLRHIEQLTGSCNVLHARSVGDEAIVSDAVETIGQHVQEKAADELVRFELLGLIAVTSLQPVILAFERDGAVVCGDQP